MSYKIFQEIKRETITMVETASAVSMMLFGLAIAFEKKFLLPEIMITFQMSIFWTIWFLIMGAYHLSSITFLKDAGTFRGWMCFINATMWLFISIVFGIPVSVFTIPYCILLYSCFFFYGLCQPT
jgi:hypothetical protein